MAQLIVDEVMLREPNLLVPGKKPVGPVTIDFSHPIGRDMLWYYLCNPEEKVYKADQGSWVTFDNDTPSTGYSFGPSDGSMAKKLSSQTSNFNDSDDDTWINNLNRQNFSFFCDFYFHNASGSVSTAVFGDAQVSGSGYNWMIYYSFASGWGFYVVTSAVKLTPWTATIDNTRYRMLCTYDGAFIRGYINGKYIGATAQTGNVALTNLQLTFNRWNNSSAIKADYFSAGIINRALSSTEAIDFTRDIYQFLIPA